MTTATAVHVDGQIRPLQSAQPRARDAERGELACELATTHAGAQRARVRYERVGPPDAPLVVVQGGISATRHVAANACDRAPGWWDEQVGRGRALDPAQHQLLAIDWLDGFGDAPVTTCDQADAIAAVLDALGIVRVRAFFGASYGAMTGLAFAQRHGARLAQLVAISGAHRAHPHATAQRIVQRRIVSLGLAHGDAAAALALARALAMLGYRTPGELEQRFGAPPEVACDGVRFACEDWLDACGAKFAQRFDARRFLALSQSIDLHAVEPALVRVPTLLVGIEQDQLVPIADLCALQSRLGAPCRLRRIASRYGHDAFLKEPETISRLLHEGLLRAQVGA